MWKNVVERDRPQITLWRMGFTFFIARFIDIYWKYLMLIAIPLQQWLLERASRLSFTLYVNCLSCISLKYNQQDATFSLSIYFYKLLYFFQAVPPPIIRSTKLYIHRQVLSNQYCCLLLSWMRWNCVPSHPRKQQYWFDNTLSCMYSFVLLMIGGGTDWNM